MYLVLCSFFITVWLQFVIVAVGRASVLVGQFGIYHHS